MQTKKMTEGLFQDLQGIASSKSSSGKKANPFLLSLAAVEGLNIVELIIKCVTDGMVVSFSVAKKVAIASGLEGFNVDKFVNRGPNSEIDKLTTIFNRVETGADALLVNAKGEHADKVRERHEVWLAEHGFTGLLQHRLEQRKAQLEALQASLPQEQTQTTKRRRRKSA
jgi:hypothetical protein